MPHGLFPLSNMNSLNIITSRVSPPSTPEASPTSRSNSIASIGLGITSNQDDADTTLTEKFDHHGANSFHNPFHHRPHDDEKSGATEQTALLGDDAAPASKRSSWWHTLPRDIMSSIITSIRWVFATLASPGVYLIACLYDEDGNFRPLAQLRKLFFVHKGDAAKLKAENVYAAAEKDGDIHHSDRRASGSRKSSRARHSSGTSSSGMSSDSEPDDNANFKSRHARSKSLQPPEEINPARRSIRIKLHNDDLMRERKHRKSQSVSRAKSDDGQGGDLSAHLKSPTSPINALTKYPKTPAPPRPLIPRREPSYLNKEPTMKQRRTLVLDLDETLIHSMSKGGRMNSGHMVEVRLNAASLGVNGQGGMGQHPILYWVNKRPFCDEFLRRVCKWFNLVVFTASVQEYADPVIDWLEQERKFFSARYYRQHCTYRQGAYIKDLSSVEPDLSNVMILDNSPLSYLFHEDNAIPIQGWINDPTDNDLMHLIPLLEGLQYVHDVRALLALRGGEDGQYAA
ncbi:NLI interacting factor-like phosphatase-domain-containing protein [Stachybotrys elegans]|uniref:NLI interacting factor-like phosphatase-domain-containing protein n=1 Tax=Stachybotrys elegans TaxID=80388 RepID=A0A8K0WVV7_9HYPO|nr:NLI interacting factor-like phosphatase-domain-containing protein [Stachybotrys elegans]